MKKRLLSMLLAVVLICSFAVPVLAAGNMERFKIQNTYESGLFRDVSVNEWYYDSIKLAYELGLVKGVSEGKFNPNGSITVMETVALACRLHSIYHGGTGEFEQHGHWYEVYYEYAIENNLLDSYHMVMDHTAVATRQDFAAILRGALPDTVLAPINEIELADIPDAFAIYEENQESVVCLYAAGILTGSDAEGTFMPNSDIQRCEVAAIVARMAIPSMRKMISLG